MWVEYDEVITKLINGDKLNESEIKTLLWKSHQVDELEGDCGRWTQRITTIVNINDELWAVDWDHGLTEHQESEYYNQPYRVQRVEKVVTRTEIIYEPIEG